MFNTNEVLKMIKAFKTILSYTVYTLGGAIVGGSVFTIVMILK